VAGYAPVSVVADLPDGIHAGVKTRLVPLGAKQTFDAKLGDKLKGNGVVLTIPADALMFEDGTDLDPSDTMVDVTLTPLDTKTEIELAPAPFDARRLDGSDVGVEPFSLVEISVSQHGSRLQLKPDKPATLELVIPTDQAGTLQIGQPFRAFWLDLVEGLWKEDAYGTVQTYSEDATRVAWSGQIPHFTWWVDGPDFSDKHCFNVTFKDATGAAWSGQKVDPIPLDFLGPRRRIIRA
jgi:hypothetical protein